MFDGLRKEDQIENHCFANDTFRSRSSGNRHAADSCKIFFFKSLTVGVKTEKNLDFSTEKEMMPSIKFGYG